MTPRAALATLVVASWVLLVSGRADATTPSAELHDGLAVELDRCVEGLALPDAPPIYHMRFTLLERTMSEVVASRGAIVDEHSSPSNVLGVEIRVGTPQFDNTNFGGWETGFDSVYLADYLTVPTLRNQAWLLADTAYKKAVEQHARKQAQWSPSEDHPGDFEMAGARTHTAQAPDPVQLDGLRELALALSEAYPDAVSLERAEVHAEHGAGTLAVLDSEETRVVLPVRWAHIRAIAHLRLDDGTLLTDHRSWIVTDLDQLPPLDQLTPDIREMVLGLVSTGEAPPLAEEYVGPVLFEDAATGALFRDLLVSQVEGTPSVTSFNTLLGGLGEGFSDSEGGPGDVRVGRRVLPQGWSAFDDPQLDPLHPAAFTHDLEGTPTRRVDLVTDGITRDLLMSRIPRKGHAGTNGHARGELGERLCGRVSLLTVEPPRRSSRSKLRRKALKMAASYGLDHVLVVRRFEDDAIRYAFGLPPMFFSMGGDGSQTTFRLRRPLEVVRLYADGREEPVRNLSFAGVHRWVLRDIAAAGLQQETTHLVPAVAGKPLFGANRGLATYISAPEVLVGEMELVPVSGDPRNAPVVPPPGVEAGPRAGGAATAE